MNENSFSNQIHSQSPAPALCLPQFTKKNWSKVTKDLRLAVLHAITPAF